MNKGMKAEKKKRTTRNNEPRIQAVQDFVILPFPSSFSAMVFFDVTYIWTSQRTMQIVTRREARDEAMEKSIGATCILLVMMVEKTKTLISGPKVAGGNSGKE